MKGKLKSTVAFCLAFYLAACGPEQTPPSPVVERTPVQAQQEAVEKATEAETVPAVPVVTSVLDLPKIKVGVMLPLSGPEAGTGKALLRAAVAAMFDAYDPRLVILPYDTQANPVEAEKMALRAVEEQVSVVLGPLLASNFQVAAEILMPAGIPLIGFTNDSRVAAPGRYIMGFLPETEVKRVVDHAIEAGFLEQAALVPDGLYGNRVRSAFGDAVSSGGGKVAAIENYPPDPEAVFEPVKRLSNYDERRKDLRDEVRFLRNLGDDLTDEIADTLAKQEVLEGISYDAVLLPEGGELLRTLAPLLPFYEIDPQKVKLLGTGLWGDPSLLREPPLQGAWFAAPHPDAPTAFLEQLEKDYGETPPRIATLAYDAMALVATIVRDNENPYATPQELFGPRVLERETGFTGIDGLFRFLPDGTVERGLAVLEIHRSGFKVVDAAPEAFPSFGFALRRATSPE